MTGVSVSAWQENLPPVIARFFLEEPVDIFMGGLVDHGDNVTQSFSQRTAGRIQQIDPGRQSARPQPGRHDPPRADLHLGGRAIPTGTDSGTNWPTAGKGTRPGPFSWPRHQEEVGSWDTSDGAGRDLPGAADRRRRQDNPAAASGMALRILGPVIGGQHPPEIEGSARSRPIDGGIAVSFTAEDQAGVLAAAGITLPDGSGAASGSGRPDLRQQPRGIFRRGAVWPPDGRPGLGRALARAHRGQGPGRQHGRCQE